MTRMKRKLLLLVILTVPALLYLNAWQAMRYRVVETEINLLEEKQQEWIEKNKKIIIGIEALSAPARINGLASEMETIKQSDSPAGIRIEMKGAGSG